MTTKTRRPARKPTAAQREATDAKLAQLGKDDLEAAVAQLDNETTWVEYLDTVATFGAKYSANNQILIYFTCLERGYTPRMVQSFNAWRDAGHPVVKGEKAIYIYGPVMRRLSKDEADAREATYGKRIPRTVTGGSVERFLVGFRPVPVFDVSQVTDPDTVEIAGTLRRRMVNGPSPELLTGSDPTGALADVERMVKSEGYELSYVAAATLHGANGNTDGHAINVRNDVDDAQKIKTVVHEWAHNRLGHTDPSFDYVADRGRAETEAEATAYVVCGALGLDSASYSAPYVASWSEGNPERIRTALNHVTTAARAMLAALTPEDEETAA